MQRLIGKDKDFYPHSILFLSRMRDVTRTREFRNGRHACKPRGDRREFYQLFECFFKAAFTVPA